MTPEEITEACDKFLTYLKENETRPLAFMLMCDGVSFSGGMSEMLDEMIVRHQADRLGFALKDKP